MLHIVFGIVCSILIILGLVEVVRIVTLMVIDSKKDKDATIIVPVSGHNEKIEFILRSIIMKAKWEEEYKNSKIMCVDCAMDDETRKICDMLCKDYEFLEVYNMSDFEKFLETNSFKKD